MRTQRDAGTARVAIVLLITLAAAACGAGRTSPSVGPRSARDSVSTGYGMQPRSEATTAVGTLTADELDATRSARVEELLQGRVAGLTVVRLANGDYSFRIRGTQSFVGNNEPLLVIDGMPLRGRSVSSVLAGLSPQDIARVDVLKDAGATALYGIDGANGVIIIRTKR